MTTFTLINTLMTTHTIETLGLKAEYDERKKFRSAVRRLHERLGQTYFQDGGDYVFPDLGILVSLNTGNQVLVLPYSGSGPSSTITTKKPSEGSQPTKRTQKATAVINHSPEKQAEYAKQLISALGFEEYVDQPGKHYWYAFVPELLMRKYSVKEAAETIVNKMGEQKIRVKLVNKDEIRYCSLTGGLVGFGPLIG